MAKDASGASKCGGPTMWESMWHHNVEQSPRGAGIDTYERDWHEVSILKQSQSNRCGGISSGQHRLHLHASSFSVRSEKTIGIGTISAAISGIGILATLQKFHNPLLLYHTTGLCFPHTISIKHVIARHHAIPHCSLHPPSRTRPLHTTPGSRPLLLRAALCWNCAPALTACSLAHGRIA